MKKEALLPLPLTIVTGNLANLEKTFEMSPIKDEFLATYSKQNFWEKIEKNYLNFP